MYFPNLFQYIPTTFFQISVAIKNEAPDLIAQKLFQTDTWKKHGGKDIYEQKIKQLNKDDYKWFGKGVCLSVALIGITRYTIPNCLPIAACLGSWIVFKAGSILTAQSQQIYDEGALPYIYSIRSLIEHYPKPCQEGIANALGELKTKFPNLNIKELNDSLVIFSNQLFTDDKEKIQDAKKAVITNTENLLKKLSPLTPLKALSEKENKGIAAEADAADAPEDP